MKRFSYTKLAYWFFGVIVTIVAGLSLVLSFLDWNQYRTPLAELASRQMGMRVELAGDVSISLFPRPAVSAESVRLSPATEGFSEVVATAERIQVRFGIGSLLGGRFSLQSMRLDGLDVTVEETGDGRWQVRGWPEGDDSSGPELELLRFRIAGGRATFLPYGQQALPVEGIALRLEGTLPGGPLSWQGEFTAAGETIVSSGRVRPVMVRDELSVKADFALAESNMSLSGRILPQGDLTGRVEISGEELGRFIASISRAVQREPVAAPQLPFHLDVQLDKKGDITRVVSRHLTIDDTRGRLDLTVARAEQKHHVTGTVAMGVINFDKWLETTDWRRSLTTEEIETPPQLSEAPRFGGAIDINIEGFQVRNGLGQRIDAVISLDEQGLGLSRASALLPGATNAAFSGKLGAVAGQGKLIVEAGNISELASWLGLAFPANIPTGRLTTADIKTDFNFENGVWSLLNIVGKVDSTELSGELSGGLTREGPWFVKLKADTVNVDAYFPPTSDTEAKDKALFAFPVNRDVTFDVATDAMQFLGQGFGSSRIAGSLKNGKLELSHALLKQEQGELQFVGSFSRQDNLPDVDVSIQSEQWALPIARHYFPSLTENLSALRLNAVDGTLTLVGAGDALNLGLEATSGDNEIVLSGTVGVSGSAIAALDLQGTFKHADLAGLLRLQEIGNLRSLPARASLSIAKPDPDAAIRFRVGGDVAGGILTADFDINNGVRRLDLTFNHEQVGAFARTTGLRLTGFDHQANLRSELRFEGAGFPDDWSLSLANLKNGDMSASGDLRVSSPHRISGSLKLTGATLSTLQKGRSNRSEAEDFLNALAQYGGSISLELADLHVAGQTVDAPAATLVLGDGAAQLSLGQDAMMNAAPVTMTVNSDLQDNFLYEGNLQAEKVDVASLLVSENHKAVVSADAALNINFSGAMNTASPLAAFKANGEMSGAAGVLNFLSVSGLTQEMQSARSGSSFLGKVGALLRHGTTAVKSFESTFAVDSGVMLVETASATGDWGQLSLDGQLNFIDEFMTLHGELALAIPPDTPAIPVSYEGNFANPTAQWSSRLFERFVISIIERRMRSALFKELEERSAASSEAGENPGVAVFTRAMGLLNSLRKAQEEKRRAVEEEAADTPKGAVQ